MQPGSAVLPRRSSHQHERPAQPTVQGRRRDLQLLSPYSSRRDLDERQVIAAGVGDGRRGHLGKSRQVPHEACASASAPGSAARCANATTGAMSTPRSSCAYSRCRVISASMTGCMIGRRNSASSAVTRWMVERITTIRTSLASRSAGRTRPDRSRRAVTTARGMGRAGSAPACRRDRSPLRDRVAFSAGAAAGPGWPG